MRRTARSLLLSLATFTVATTVSSAVGHAADGYQRPGMTERVSVSSSEAQARYTPWPVTCTSPIPVAWSDISADGRYVVFEAVATNLVSGAAGRTPSTGCKVFWRDRVAGVTKLVSAAMSGAPASGQSGTASISATGRYVAFYSEAANLVPGDTNTKGDIFVRDMKAGRTVRASVATGGSQVGDLSCPGPCTTRPSISGNGRYVAFASEATNVVAGDTNAREDVFVHDLKTGKTRRVSVSSNGAQGDSHSGSPTLNHDGRYVAFTSSASNLAPGGNPEGSEDVYRRDMKTGKTIRVSVASDGSLASFAIFPNCLVGTPPLVTLPPPLDGLSNGYRLRVCGSYLGGYGGHSISADGRYIAFTSNATNLVPNDTNFEPPWNGHDIFVHDVKTRRTERASVDSYGRQRDDAFSHWATISGDGRVVSYGIDPRTATAFCGLVPVELPDVLGDSACGERNAYVYDRMSGAMEQTSVSGEGAKPTPGSCYGASTPIDSSSVNVWPGPLSYDGRYVSFQSSRADLVAGDTNNSCDYFVRDRGRAVGTGSFGGSGAAPGPDDDVPTCLTEDVCLPPVAMADAAGDVRAEAADLVGARVVPRSDLRDLFVRLDLANMPAVSGAPVGGLLYGLAFTAGGQRYEVRVQRVPGADYDVKGGASFGLFRQDRATGLFSKVASLKGGYGTTGASVVVAVPATLLGAGTQLADVRAFTALGSYHVGVSRLLDAIRLSR